MAVEAHHLLPFPSSQFLSNRELIFGTEENHQQPPPSFYDVMQMGGFAAPISGFAAAAAAAPVTAATDNGLTALAAPAGALRKRPRQVSFLGDDRISSSSSSSSSSFYLQHQMLDLDLDRLVLQHAENVQAELAERRRRFARQISVAVEEGVSKRLKAKEDEIARLGKLNWAIEERIKSLSVENQIWRDLAQSSEAAANSLRTKLEQLLAAAAAARARVEEAEAATLADDAESCCCGDNGGGEEEEEEEEEKEAEGGAAVNRQWRRGCRRCGEREPAVLLLPCRHLCLCAACGPAAAACPVCNCTKNGSVHVNMS